MISNTIAQKQSNISQIDTNKGNFFALAISRPSYLLEFFRAALASLAVIFRFFLIDSARQLGTFIKTIWIALFSLPIVASLDFVLVKTLIRERKEPTTNL